MMDQILAERLDRLQLEIHAVRVEQAAQAARSQARYDAQALSISQFWELRWPKVEAAAERVEGLAQDVHRLAMKQDDHSGRLSQLEKDLQEVQARKDEQRANVALLAGIAALFSSLSALFKPWTWGN